MPRNDSTVPKKGKSKGTYTLPDHITSKTWWIGRVSYSSRKENCNEEREIFKLQCRMLSSLVQSSFIRLLTRSRGHAVHGRESRLKQTLQTVLDELISLVCYILPLTDYSCRDQEVWTYISSQRSDEESHGNVEGTLSLASTISYLAEWNWSFSGERTGWTERETISHEVDSSTLQHTPVTLIPSLIRLSLSTLDFSTLLSLSVVVTISILFPLSFPLLFHLNFSRDHSTGLV